MKKRWMMLLVVIAAGFNGCAHVPSWALRAHVDGYNRLHPDSPVETGLEE